MDIGLILPQGWTGEYDGWDPARAWARTVAVAQTAERLGFESLWVFDHVQTVPVPTDEITFESFTTLTAIAALTQHVRLGHVVLCAPFRNAALTSKMISTLDVVSGGRAVLGLGAGWKEDEFRGYGYPYPELKERLAILRETLEIATRMLNPGRATYAGERLRVDDAINVPKGLQSPRVPIMVGGNGPVVTWRLAARFADELNLDWMKPARVAESLPIIRSRCEEVGRDPSTLRISVNIGRDWLMPEGQVRVDLLAGYRELGIHRVMGLLPASVDGDEGIARLADDARAAGVTLRGETA
jgi:F420-dependent oxidoreductase-like protein